MRAYERIVFVAESGTSRAPMAEALFRENAVNCQIEVESRGLVVLFPEPLNQKTEAVMISNGINLEGYMSRQITPEDVDPDTLVIAMDQSQRQKLLDLLPEADPEQLVVLNELVGEELPIMDPYGGTLQAYGLCFETLSRTIKKLIKIINEGEQTNGESSSDGSPVDPA